MASVDAESPGRRHPAPTEGDLPRHRAVAASCPDDALCRRLDDLPSELRLEDAANGRWGRLGPIRPEGMAMSTLAQAASGQPWETLAKVLPLPPHTREAPWP